MASQALSATLMPEPIPNDNTVSQKCGNIWSLHLGTTIILALNDMDLLHFFEHCEQGIQITTRMVRKFAEKTLNYVKKFRKANQQSVWHFLHQVGSSQWF